MENDMFGHIERVPDPYKVFHKSLLDEGMNKML